MRVFVAFRLPRAACSALGEWRDRALSGQAGLRPVPTDSMHVTLCFLGELSVERAEDVVRVCRAVVKAGGAARGEAGGAAGPLWLELGHPLWLPPGRPRVLAVSLNDSGDRLRRLQGQLADALASEALMHPEPRDFLPHVTVARVQRAERRGGGPRRSTVPRGVLPRLPGLSVRSGCVAVMRSHLGSGPARYVALATMPLATGD